jgi:hypothetical protein
MMTVMKTQRRRGGRGSVPERELRKRKSRVERERKSHESISIIFQGQSIYNYI